ncbi:hypothetical protein AAFC00_000861 [Neodothiora populina]
MTSAALAIPWQPRPWERDEKVYPGWAGIEYMFIFGDSYTQTGFNISLAQPNPSNPLGNPDYPGATASNGPNWVDFLTTTYNESFIETVNLAYGGATVDTALVTPYLPTVLSFIQQVQEEYLPVYSSSPSFLPWQSSNTLFGVFIGINDIDRTYYTFNNDTSSRSTLESEIFSVYASLIDDLYSTGARNFLLMNVPPIDRSPGTVGATNQSLEASMIADYNSRLSALATDLSSSYPDATMFLFDTNAAFAQILADPCSLPQTCDLANNTAYCQAYVDDADIEMYTFIEECGVSVDRYFWLNWLHPGFRVNNGTAALIAQFLGG